MEHHHREVIQLVRNHEHIHPGGPAETMELWQAMDLPMGSKVLDLGAGFGGPAHWLRGAGADVLALDLEQANCLRCRGHNRDLPMPTVRADAARLPLASASMDGVIAWCTLGFVEEQAGLFSEVARVLRPGGRFGVDVYTVRDAALYDPSRTPMRFIHSRERWLELIEASPLTLVEEADLSEQYADDYRRFMVNLKVQIPSLRVRFGREQVADAVTRFSRNVHEVLFGGKGGLRLVCERGEAAASAVSVDGAGGEVVRTL
jgi:SAM-dependent methyltransferase